MHPAECARLWDSIAHLRSNLGTVMVLGDSTRATSIGAEGTARNIRVLHAGTSEDCVEHFNEQAHWYTVDIVIISDIREPSTDKIPPHATVVDTACQPWETFGHRINDYHWWDGHTLSSMWHMHNNQPVYSFPEANSPVCISNDFYEVYPELWYRRDAIGWIYYGPTPHQGDPSRLTFEQQCANIQLLLDQGKRYIMMCNADEALQLIPTGWAHRVARYFHDRVPENTFWFVTGCINGDKVYRDLCALDGEAEYLNPVTWHRFEQCMRTEVTGSSIVHEYAVRNEEFEPEQVAKTQLDESVAVLRDYEYRIEPKQWRYLSFSRMPRWQRIQLVTWLSKNNLLHLGLNSFDLSQCGDRPGDNADNRVANRELCETVNALMTADLDAIREHNPQRADSYAEFRLNCWHHTVDTLRLLEPQLPLTINRTVERDNPVQICLDDLQYHERSRFSIVNETLYYSGKFRAEHDCYPHNLQTMPGNFISEKLYKPLSYCHPFVLFSRPGTLEVLRNRDFGTFAHLWDESYDEIEDDAERFRRVCAVIQRIATMPDEEWLEWGVTVRNIVQRNRDIFFDLSQGNTMLAVTNLSKMHE